MDHTAAADAIGHLITRCTAGEQQYPLFQHIVWNGRPEVRDGCVYYYRDRRLVSGDARVLDNWETGQFGLGGAFIDLAPNSMAMAAYTDMAGAAWRVARSVLRFNWPNTYIIAALERPEILWTLVLYATAWCRASPVLQAKWLYNVHVLPVAANWEPVVFQARQRRLRRKFPFNTRVDPLLFMRSPVGSSGDSMSWSLLEPNLFGASAIVLQILRRCLPPEQGESSTVRQMAAALDLSRVHVQILMVLASPPQRRWLIKDLAAAIRKTRDTTGKRVEELVQMGLVRRGETDKSGVGITEKGLEILAPLQAPSTSGA